MPKACSEVFLYPFWGRLLYRQNFKGENHQIPVKSFPQGVYVLKVKNYSCEITQKIVKN
ncbi:T9SS type A sorting domain-containing protein [Sinomicrobium sp. M5D2P17]